MSYRIHDAYAPDVEPCIMSLTDIVEGFGGEAYGEIEDKPALVLINRGNQELFVLHGSLDNFSKRVAETIRDSGDYPVLTLENAPVGTVVIYGHPENGSTLSKHDDDRWYSNVTGRRMDLTVDDNRACSLLYRGKGL